MQKIVLDQRWIEELKAKNEITSVISSYVQLNRKGRNYWGCCPFHHEKTPSFCVNDMDQFYHCFGCGETGDVIKFVQKMENCDFIDAVKILAKKCGMELPEFEVSDDLKAQKAKKEKMLEVLDLAMNHYVENLYKKEAKAGQDYCKQRKLNKKALDVFKIGYSLDWEEILKFLNSKGYENEFLKDSGLADNKDGKRYYDFYGGRLIFPLFNVFDECVGFSGRFLGKTDMAKYKNTPTTMVFDKSRTIFGIQNLKRLKKEGTLKNIILVEGQMDVISMFIAGFENTVATLGTALTPEHAKLLKRFNENIVLCFDGDGAGLKATIKGIDILVENGLNVKVITIPNGKDPDEYIKENGKEAMEDLIQNAINCVDFKIIASANNLNLKENHDRARFVGQALNIINKLSNGAEKEVYLGLVKKLTGLPTDILRRDLEKLVSSSVEPNIETTKTIDSEDASNKCIKFILASLLNNKNYALINFDFEKILKNNSYVKLYNIIKENQKNGKDTKKTSLFDIFDVDNEPNIKEIINFEFSGNDNKEYFDACVWQVYDNYLTEKQKELTERYKNCSDLEERKQISQTLYKITMQKKNKVIGGI